jgi:hypothetical protein
MIFRTTNTQAAQSHVDGDHQGRKPDAEVQVPSRTTFITRAIEYILMPLIRMVMKAKLMAENAPCRKSGYGPGSDLRFV